jgi:hypothetical protein
MKKVGFWLFGNEAEKKVPALLSRVAPPRKKLKKSQEEKIAA